MLIIILLKAHSKDFPHLMFYGPSGAGKKTRISCVLRELYGSGAEKLKIEQQTFTVSIERDAVPLSMSENIPLDMVLFSKVGVGWVLQDSNDPLF